LILKQFISGINTKYFYNLCINPALIDKTECYSNITKYISLHPSTIPTVKAAVVQETPLHPPALFSTWQGLFFHSKLASLCSSLSAMVAGLGELGQEGTVSKKSECRGSFMLRRPTLAEIKVSL